MTEKRGKIQGKWDLVRVSGEFELTEFELAGSTALCCGLGIVFCLCFFCFTSLGDRNTKKHIHTYKHAYIHLFDNIGQ